MIVSVILEMLTRMVIFAIFHSSVCAGKFISIVSNSNNYQNNNHNNGTLLVQSQCESAENCIRMCCESKSECDKMKDLSYTFNRNFSFIPDFSRPCENKQKYTKEFTIENGKIQINENSNEEEETTTSAINLSNFCLHLPNDTLSSSREISYSTNGDNDDIQLLICDDDELQTGDIEKQFHKSLVRVIGTSISLPLLIITLFVLWWLNQFQTIHGKCLMCHIVSLILLYTFLILDRMDILIMKIAWLCEISGYMMYTSILFCIFWLNVMCFDIWKTFKKTRNPQYLNGPNYFYFCLFHGFGVPTIVTLFLAIIDETELFPENWRPQIGRYECFLRNERHIEFFYLYLPMSIILLANIVLYSATAYKIYKVQNDKFILSGKIDQRRRVVSCNPIRMRFFLYLRLFLLMGLTWSMEAISWIFDANSTSFFIVSDVANSIHGFIIFGLFVCRTNVVDSVLTKQRSNNRLTSSMIFGKFQDSSKRNSLTNEDVLMKFLKDKRAGNC